MLNGKRIAFVVADLGFFFSHRLGLAQHAKRAGAHVIVISPSGGQVSRLKEEGFEHAMVPFHRSRLNPFAEFSTVLKLRDTYRRLKLDVVHQVALKPIVYGGLACLSAPVPLVINTFSGLGYAFTERTFKRNAIRRLILSILRFTFRSASHRVVFQNPDDSRYFVRKKVVNPEQCVVILGSGVDTTKFRPNEINPSSTFSKTAPIRAIYGGRMLWDKGLRELHDAAVILKQRELPIQIQLVGSTDSANPACVAKSILEEWNRDGVIRWLGSSRDMATIMRESDLAILPSYREGLPLFLLEAAASGLPLVATDVPGCREVIQHGINGFLVPVKSVEPLADAIQQIQRDRKSMVAMGQASRGIALSHFDSSKIHDAYLRLYQGQWPLREDPLPKSPVGDGPFIGGFQTDFQ